MHDPPLERRHRLELDRIAELQRALGRLIRLHLKRLRATGAVAVGVDRHAPAGRAGAEHDPLREMLEGVDRLATAANQQAKVLALKPTRQRLLIRLDHHAGVKADMSDNLDEQLA
jgi:hypothetical protein